MKQNVLLRRIFFVIIAALVSVTLFTGLAYNIIFNIRFAFIKGEQLMPKARALGRIVSHMESDRDLRSAMEWIISQTEEDFSLFFGTSVLLYDSEGQLTMTNLDTPVSSEFITPLLERTLEGRDASATGMLSPGGNNMLVVGCPVFREDGSLLGSVFLCLELEESLSDLNSIVGVWPFSLLMAAPVVLLMMYILINQIIKPIRQMRDTANAMATGNFSVRANESPKGEVGQLARALNYLCTQLSAKIDELTVERDRLRQSVDGLSEGFMSVNALGGVSHCNPALKSLFPEARQYDDPRMALVPDEEVWQSIDKALTCGESAAMEMKRSEKVIFVAVTPIKQGGAVALFTDVTQSARLERTRREYVANVSHELRTPLTSMRALMEPLKDGMVQDEDARQRYYGIILGEISRLSRLIDDLMELSRLQSDSVVLQLEPVSLQPILSDLAFKYRAIAEEKNQTVDLFLPEHMPMVMAEEDRLEELLVILLDNALKYTPEGGSVRLGARRNQDKMEIFVRDTGIGISAADLPYVFDRFYKTDKSHSGRGSGLGLSIAKEILSRMGEDISVISTPGSGSEFYFTLRCCDTAASQMADTSDT